ncbi:MAG: cobalamin B12-binding domain-containing protein [Dehalococcoidia bacterium]|nr:cobalamin B12-binding domain-containing protein [Dehalococcoidia bacterium]MDP6783730.1 cobalamin B12-binding domain-containing protein [Dehalococcoidia bacterium]
MTKTKKIRVLMAKLGFDGHDRGVKVVTAALRQAGMEVIYTGPWQTVEAVVETALQEDVDLIGISSLAYDHPLIPKLMARLKERDADIPVIVGGVIPPDDVRLLQDAGVKGIFPPGSTLQDITSCIQQAVS